MTTSKMTAIDRAMAGARRRTKAEVARNLADGLPIATVENGQMEVHQIVDGTAPQFVAVKVKSAHHTGAPLRAISASALRNLTGRRQSRPSQEAPVEAAE